MIKEFNAFIFARGGSKGIPNKNLRKINGISLVRRSIDLALELENVSKVFLSTDSDLIADEANIEDVEIIKRPLELADDNSPELANHLDCNNKNLTEVGTVSGDNLQIDFGTLS